MSTVLIKMAISYSVSKFNIQEEIDIKLKKKYISGFNVSQITPKLIYFLLEIAEYMSCKAYRRKKLLTKCGLY